MSLLSAKVQAQDGRAVSSESVIQPIEVRAGVDQTFTFAVQVLQGAPSTLRIKIPWAGAGATVRSVDRNGQPMWLLNQATDALQPGVVTWSYDSSESFLVFRAFRGDLKANDVLSIQFIVHIPQSAKSAEFESWLGTGSSSVPSASKSMRVNLVGRQQ